MLAQLPDCSTTQAGSVRPDITNSASISTATPRPLEVPRQVSRSHAPCYRPLCMQPRSFEICCCDPADRLLCSTPDIGGLLGSDMITQYSSTLHARTAVSLRIQG